MFLVLAIAKIPNQTLTLVETWQKKKLQKNLNKRHQKLAESNPHKKVDILSRYVSILSVGDKKI